MKRVCFPALILVALATDSVRAERPPQDRDAAPVVVTGTVEAVDEEWDWQTDYYKISVRVEELERGDGIRPGDLIVVSCFQWSRPPPGYAGASGHRSIPDVGDKIRLFALGRGAELSGNYPDWYDLIEPSPRPWFVRIFGYRKFRVFALVVVVCIAMFATWRVWKARRRAAA